MKLSTLSTLRKMIGAVAIGHSVMIFAIMVVNILYVNESAVELALGAARAKFDKDMQYRNWMTGVGGVYVQTSDSVRINPYIEYHERDVTTPSGRMLTLLNPMYMIEQVFRTPSDTFGTVSRMVSLDTTRNVGRPDAWEQEALQDFAQGGMERYTVETMNGQEVLRFIKPVFGVPFVPGNSDARPLPSYRGALSYMIPLAEVEIHQERDFLFDIGILAVIWVLGLVGIYIFGRLLRQELYRRIQDQDRFRQVTELSTDIIYIVDRTGRIIRGNASFYRHIGADAELRPSVRLADFVRHESESELLSRLEQLFREPSTFESRHRNAAGTEIPVEITAIPVTIDDERYLYCTGRDISERKQREEKVKRSEQLFRQIWEQTGEGLRLTDANGIITKVNDAYCRLVEKSREELEGKPLSVVYSPEKKEEIIRKHISHFAHHVIQQNNEKEIELWNGERRWVYVSNSYVLTEGHQLQLLGTFRDITEQKRIEERIHRSDEQLRLVTRNSQDLIFRYEVRPAARFLFVSPSAVTITGYTPEELYADPSLMERIIDPEDRRRTSYAIVRSIEDRITVEVRVTTKQGAVIWTEQKITISRDAQQRVTAFEAIARDITERKRVEDELKSYNGLLTSMLENIPLDFWVRDKDGTMLIHSKAGRQFWGDLKGKQVESSVEDPAIIRRWQENNERALGGEIVRGERDYILPTNGERRTIFEVVAPFYIDGQTAGLLGINMDITEQRQLNDRLELQSAALNAAANAIVITDHAGIIEWVNPSFETLTGYRSAEAVGQDVNTLVRSGVHPDQFYATLWETVRAGKPWAGEMVNRKKNGTLYVEEQTLTPLMDPHGAIVHYIGIKQDVTEKKKVERQIVRDEQKFRSYMDAAPLGIFVKDRDGNFEEVNPAGLHMFGRTAAEMLGAHSSAFIDPAYRSAAKEFTSIVLHGGFASADLLFRRKDGTPFWVRENSVRLSDGKVISYKEDITSRREMERRLFDAHQQNTALFEQSSVGMAIAGLDRSIRRVNQRFAEMLGYTTEELVGRTIDSITHPEDREVNKELSERLYSSLENSFTMEKRYFRKDGSLLWVRIDIVMIRDEQGKPSYLAGIVQDINQEKNISLAVRNLAINAGSDGPDTVFGNIVHNLAEALNADMSFIGLLWDDDRSVTTRAVYRSNGNSEPFTYRLEGTPCERVLEKGTVYFADNVADLFPQDRALKALGMRSYLGMSLVDSRGRSIGVLVVLSRTPIHMVQNYGDVLALFGERTVKELQAIEAEEALRRSEEEYRFLVDHAQDVLLRISVKGIITYCSRSIERLIGFTPEEVTGTSIKRYFPDRNDIERAYYHVKTNVISQQSSRLELRLRLRTGGMCWVEAIGNAVMYPDGHREIHVVLRDISERKKHEEELMHFRRIISATVDSVSLVDDQFRYRIVNEAYERSIGRKYNEIIGMTVPELFGAEVFQQKIRPHFERCLAGEEVRYQAWFDFPLEGRRYMDVQYIPYNSGQIRGALVSSRDISAVKQAEEAVIQSEQRYRGIVESSIDGYWIIDLQGRIVEVNDVICEMTGYSREEMVVMSVSDIDAFEQAEETQLHIRKIIDEGRDRFEAVHRRKDGERLIVEVSAVYLPEQELVLAFISDITLRKKTEQNLRESERRFRGILENVSLIALILDTDARITMANDYVLALLGWKREEFIGQTWFDIALPVEVRDSVRSIFQHAVTMGEIPKHYENEIITRSGERRLIRWNNINLYDANGGVIGITSIGEDVTDIRKAVDALQRSKEQYQLLADNSMDLIALHSPDGRYVYTSPSVRSILGYETDELLGMTPYDIVHPEDARSIHIGPHESALRGEPHAGLEARYRHKQGEYRWLETKVSPITDPSTGSVVQIQAISRDITDKKRADQAVLDQRNELANIISNLPGYIYRITPEPEMRCLFISDVVEEITGYLRSDYMADNFAIQVGAIHPDDLVRYTEVMQYAVSNKQQYELEYRFRRKDGVQIWLWERGNPVLDDDGNIRYIEGYVSDISLSKTALEGLQQSEQRFRVVWESTNEAMRLTDAEGNIVMVNEAYCTLAQLSREELIGAPISVVYPQERAAHVMERYRENFETRDVLEFFEQDITLKNGSVIFVQASNVFLHLTGEETLLLSVFRDITARVHAERDVMLSEQRYRSLIETSLDGFWAVSMDGRILEVNDAYCRMSGYSREQMLTKSVSDLEVNERPEDVLERIRTIQEKGKLKFESHHRTRSGEVVLMEINTVYHREWDEILAFFNNITSKRAAEQALIERELQYRTLISTMHQGMAFHEMLFDAAGAPIDYRFLDVNPSFESLTGLTASEIIGRTVLEVMPQTERHWIETYGAVVRTGVPSMFENYLEALGKYFEVVAYRPKPGHFATIITDITDRKRSEELVVANERRYRLLAENSTDVIWTMTFEGKFTYISPSVYQLRGYTPEEVMQQSMEEVICPGSIPIVMEGLKLHIRQAQNNEPVPQEFYEVEQPCRNGTTVWTEVVTHIMRDEQGAPTGIIGVSRDITSRKRSEDLLRARLLLSEYATTHSVKDLLRKILDEAERITESTIGFFHFVEDDQRTISLQTWSTNTLANMCQAEGDGKHYPIDKAGVWVECVHQRAPVVHNDFANVANKKGMPAGHAPVLRELLIPIMRNEKVVGIMGVGNKAFNYDQRDVEIASQLATMSWDILERRRAELSLQHQEQALAGLSTAAVQLLHMNERNRDETIDSALKELGTGLEADRVYIFQNIMDRNSIQYTSMVHEWSRDGISRELQNPKMQYLRFDLELPTMWHALREGNSLNAFTYELTEQERTILEEQQIQSIILVPITIEERFWGFLGVDAVRTARRWSPDEESVIRVAAESFGIAIQRITAVAQLFEREQMLKFALEASGDGVWNYTIPTRELYISREAKQLAGYQDDEFPNLFEAWIDKIHPEDRAAVQIDMDRHLRGEAPLFLNEHRLLCKDGTYRWMLDRGKVLTWNKDGTPYQIFGTYSDIHHRKETEEKVKELNEQLEQKVTERTKQLRDSMQEMESFSYTISHDLRAPVRAIDSFTKILSDEEEARLSAEGKRLLNNVRANTSRMGRMIDDLLQFSRASRAEITKVPFDMEALMAKVAEEARAVEPQRSIRISVQPLPKAFGDPSLLRQVAVNLVGNAVKFTRHCADAQIEIGGVETDGELTYWVKDNGTGFDMRYADKLFGVFQRLHGQQEFEGTGVGLAIVHRILQKHGGSITVQSQEGTGTTFTFTIPAQP